MRRPRPVRPLAAVVEQILTGAARPVRRPPTRPGTFRDDTQRLADDWAAVASDTARALRPPSR